MSPSPRRLHVFAAWLLLVVAFAVFYRGTWDQWFYSDDFEHLLRVRDQTAWQLVQHDVLGLANFREQKQTVYWRPGWYLMYRAIFAQFGLQAAAFIAVQLLLHLTMATAIFALLVKRTRNLWIALGTALLFSSAPAYAEAVIWPAAALEVLPSALLLLATGWAYLRFLETRREAFYALAGACFLGSFLFKEAAYHIPLLIFAGHWLMRPRERGAALLRPLPFGAVVLLHHVFLNKIGVDPVSLSDRIVRLPEFIAQYGRELFGLGDLATGATLLLGLPLFALCLWLSKPQARYFLVWAVIAMFPYVIVNVGSRFMYFVHFPFAIFVGLFLHQWIQARRTSRTSARVGLGLAALMALLTAVNVTRLPAAFQVHIDRSTFCRAVLDTCRDQGLAAESDLFVERIPVPLMNGFEPMLALYTDGHPRIHDLRARRVPPFFVYRNAAFEDAPADATFLANTGTRYERASRSQFLAGLIPAPLFGFVERFEVEPDPAAALARLATVNLAHTAILASDPALTPPAQPSTATPPAEPQARYIPVSNVTHKFELTTPTRALFVFYGFAPPAQLRGRVTVDGAVVPVVTANLAFAAITVEPGTHEVVVSLR